VEPPADRDWTPEQAPTSASGWAAATSALRAVAVMAVAKAVVDGNAA
jgi:hypothetical protein